MTAERFIDNPCYENSLESFYKMAYKTGDLGYLNANSDIVYLGRNDFQVKIHGYRIELDEISSVLSQHPGISQATVVANKINQQDQLIAYYISETKVADDALFELMRSKLPDYMVPKYCIHMSAFPLSINGKLDLKALPDVDFAVDENFLLPSSSLEKQLVSIWSSLLGLESERINCNMSFFTLGGDSILSIQLVSQIRQQLGLTVNVSQIYKYPTIVQMRELLSSSKSDSVENYAEQGRLTGTFNLLPIQTWFFQNNFISQVTIQQILTAVHKFKQFSIKQHDQSIHCFNSMLSTGHQI